MAGALFVIPSIFILWALSYIYVAFGNVPWIAAIFYGLKPAVLAIVAGGRHSHRKQSAQERGDVGDRVGRICRDLFFPRAISVDHHQRRDRRTLGGQLLPQYFRGRIDRPLDRSVLPGNVAASREANLASSRFKISVTWILIWALPLDLPEFFSEPTHTIFREGIFFSKAAVVTFGGAYAVLPYVSQQAVDIIIWLLRRQMLDGLGLAETTPGP